MAQVALTPTRVTSASVVATTLTAATTGSYSSGGNSFVNTATTFLIVKNADAGSHTMTVSWVVDGVTVTRTQAIAAGATRIFYFNPAIYGATVNIQFEDVTSVTVGVFYV